MTKKPQKPSQHTLIGSALATLVFIAFSPTTHAAEPATDSRGEKWKSIDKNADGKLSREEVAAHPGLLKHFDQVDTDKDGLLSQAEMKSYAMKKRLNQLKAIDADNDGRISRAEAEAKAPRMAKHFDQLDTNQDGFISKDELIAAHARRQRN